MIKNPKIESESNWSLGSFSNYDDNGKENIEKKIIRAL